MKIIKRLASCIREFKRACILSPVYVSLEVAMEVIMPLVIAKFGSYIEDGNMKMTLIVGFILLGMAFLSLLFGVLSARQCAKASTGFAKNLREDLFNKVQEFSFENIDKFSSSSLVTRLTTDVTNVQMAFMMIIRIAVRTPLMLIFSLIMSFTVDSTLPFIFCIIIPILAFALLFIIKQAMPIFRRVFKRYDVLNNSVQENIKGMRVVKAYVREDYEKDKFNRSAEGVCADFTKAEKILAFNRPVMNLCIYGAMIGISYFGARIIISAGGVGTMSVFGLSSFLTYSMQILMSLMMLSMVFVMITLAIESSKRIYEVLSEEPTIKNGENPIFDVKDGSIDFDNVCFKYTLQAEKNALENINLHINSGETIGIIGGTGASKTTLVNLISRLYDVTCGEVKVGGVDVRDYDVESLRDAVSVVLQKNVLFSGSIKENLRWGDKNATDEEIVRVCKLAQADEFIEGFPYKYDTFIEQGGTNVSGGQKQRLCIARALLKKPKILILDDSTSAVDTKTDALIREAFKNEIPNTTKIIIAQRISSVQDADKIIVMENGTINGFGTHEELIKNNEIYREVYSSQNRA